MVGREKTVQEFLHFPYNLLFSLHPSSVKQLCCACYLLFISSFVCQGVRRQILTSVMREFVLSFPTFPTLPRQGAFPPGLQHRTFYIFLLLTIHFCLIFSLFSFIFALKISTCFSFLYHSSYHFIS